MIPSWRDSRRLQTLGRLRNPNHPNPKGSPRIAVGTGESASQTYGDRNERYQPRRVLPIVKRRLWATACGVAASTANAPQVCSQSLAAPAAIQGEPCGFQARCRPLQHAHKLRLNRCFGMKQCFGSGPTADQPWQHAKA